MDLPIELISYLDSLPEPHILCDRSYHILAANAAYRRSCCDGTEVVGRTCYEVSHHYSVPCDQAGESCPLQRSLQSGQRERVVHLHHTPQGEDYENIELAPIRHADGEIAYFIEKLESLGMVGSRHAGQGLIGRAPAFQAMMELVARVAPSEASVLLEGESGSGKEVVAHAIHQASRRAGKPFIVVDCSGLPETLFESELFGHERGAFTGATARKPGLIEAADGGTVFLDELGDIPLGMQVKLLRLLETGTYRRVGSTELRHADIRVISATHRPLRCMVEDGRFRQDLYYRINTFPITVPPLRQRTEDLPALCAQLLERVAPGRELHLSPEAMARLATHDFPGNVRELRNILERSSLMCDGDVIRADHLPPELGAPPRPDGMGGEDVNLLERIEQDILARVVAGHQGNRKELARALGVSERTLYRRLKAAKTRDDEG